MVIREAVRFGQGYLYTEEEGFSELETRWEEGDAPTAWQEIEPDIGGNEDSVPDVFDNGDTTSEPDEQELTDTGYNAQSEPKYYAAWTNAYKEARAYLYGTPEIEPDAEAAYEFILEEAERGNAYAMYDMGKIYTQGIFVEPDKEKAEKWYGRTLSAMLAINKEKKNACLQYRIGKMYQYGLGTKENLVEAAAWFSKAADQEYSSALYALGMLTLHGKGVKQDYAKAFNLFRCAYKKGNPYAAYELGKLYESGKGTEKNQEKAENCFCAAFSGFLNLEKKSKDDNLWYRIGNMYLHGIGTEADEMRAEKYFVMSAEYGNAHAVYQLAKLFIRHELKKFQQHPEVTPDYEKIRKAAALLTKAASQGNAFADYALGKLYSDGVLTVREMNKTFFHLHKAADAGNVYAQYRLGKWYLTEEYKDISKAIFYLTKAAAQNSDMAAYQLGKLYLSGEGIPKNVEQAVFYLELSVHAGNQYAQYFLGKAYLTGTDVERDKEKAYGYLRLAAEQGNVYAAYFLQHWNDMPHPDLLLMASRLMHHLGKIMEENVDNRKSRGSRMGIDCKLAGKIKAKKIAQGHAEDDREEMVQTQ
jgi:hypothetical protein